MKHQNLRVLRKTAIFQLLFIAYVLAITIPAIGSANLDPFADLDTLSAPEPTQPTSEKTSTNRPATPISTISSSSDDLTFDELEAPIDPIDGRLAPKPSADEEIGLPIDLPVIGTVNLIPFSEKDQTTGKDISGMKVYVPNKGKKLVAGPLTLDQGELRLIGDVPSYSARATLLGSSATLSLKNATKAKKAAEQDATPAIPGKMKAPSFSQIVFGIKFDKNPTIELIPGKKAELTNVDLVLEKTKPIKLIATTSILGQTITIYFSITKERTNAWATLKNVPFDSIIPQLKGTEAEKVILTSFKFTAQDLVSKTKKTTTYLINGKADVSQLAGIESSSPTQDEAKNVTIKGSYTKETGGEFTLNAKSLTLGRIGIINDAKLKINTKPVTLKLIGNTHISFPGVGEFDTTIDASITKAGITFSSKIAQTVTFANIDIRNIALNFSSAKKSISLTGDGQVQGYQTKIILEKDAKGGIIAEAELMEKEIKPFASIPGISQITLKNPTFKFSKKATGYELAMTGTVNIYGLQLDGTLNVAKTSRGDTVTLVKAEAPANWKLSDGMSSLKGTLFDNIELEQLTFIVSSNDYHDSDKDVTYKKGMNFVSITNLSGPLVPVGQFTGTPPTSKITIVGYLAPNPIESVFRASIPNGVVLKNDSVTLGKLELEIAGKPEPVFSLLTTLLVKPSPKDETLTLTARILFKGTPPIVSLAATMQGFWSHPFGMSGLEIGNVAAQIGFGPTFPATGIPASIGLAGQMTIGARHVAMALKIPLAGEADTVLCGALDKLTLDDVIQTAIQMASKASSKKISPVQIPDVGIEDMKLYVAPKATTIGELSFDKGLTVRGIIFVPGFKAFGNLTVSQSGLIAQASCTEIKYGGTKDNPFLLISRAREDKTCAPTDIKELSEKIKSSPTPPVPAATKPSNPDLLELVDALDSLDTLDTPAPPANESQLPKNQQESLESARSADVACAPDSKLLQEYCGPTMHIILNMEQALDKQGILVSGLFKVGDIFEQDSYFRMDKDGIEFNFLTALGKSVYVDKDGKKHSLLQTLINGKSSGGLSNPDFNLILEFQQYLITYAKEQTAAAIAKAKEDVHKGVASAQQESESKLRQASEDASKGIDKAKAHVQKAKDALDAINKQIEMVKSKMREAIEDARKNRASLDADIQRLKDKISQKQKECS